MNRRARVLASCGSAAVLAVLLATAAWVGPTPRSSASAPAVLDTRALQTALTRSSHALRAGVACAHAAADGAPRSPDPDPDRTRPRALSRDPGAPDPRRAPALAELDAAAEAKLGKLAGKLAKSQAKQVGYELTLVEVQAAEGAAVVALALATSLLDDAEQDLADAKALPADTPEQKQARKAAIKAAKQALKPVKKSFKGAKKAHAKASKTVQQLGKKIAKEEAKQGKLVAAIEDIDPGYFASAQSAPLLHALANASQVVLTWTDVPGADGYRLYWSTQPGVTPENGQLVDGVSSPHVSNGLPLGFTLHAVVVAVVDGEPGPPSNAIAVTTSEQGDEDGGLDDGDGNGGDDDGDGNGGDGDGGASFPYAPPWADATPQQILTLDHDPQLSDTANGAALRAAVSALQAGDMLVVGGGTWSVQAKFSPVFAGTAQAPVWIVAAEGETPVITRPDAGQNVLNPSGSYGVLRGFEITGGSAGIRLGASSHLWLDQLHIHDTPEAALTANTADTDHLYITRNHIHHVSVGTSGTGEGMYLGANHGEHVMRESVIALNHVHDTEGSQGDGIEVKQGSWGNRIVENLVHDTRFPALIVYGTDGQPQNLIERNVLLRSDAQTLQVQGEAIVRNNLIVGGDAAFQSHDHQGSTRDLEFVHNTILTTGKGANLAHWGGRPGMVFANNVVYSQSAQSVTFGSGSAGVAWAGNVLLGGTAGAPGGATSGNGLADFEDASWDGSAHDVTPKPGSPIAGAGSATYAVEEDLSGELRSGAVEPGCVDLP